MIFEGMCIGGPLAGQWLEHDSPHYKYLKMGEVSFAAPEVGDEALMFTNDNIQLYNFCEHFLHLDRDDVRSAWLHESIKTGLAGVREVLSFYSVNRGGN